MQSCSLSYGKFPFSKKISEKKKLANSYWKNQEKLKAIELQEISHFRNVQDSKTSITMIN